MAYEPLHHKYRPQTFTDLVGQETIALTLSNALQQAKIAPAYLFTGPRGTGKTSSARILAKSLNCLASDRPTPHPCGKCEVCLAIAKGSALDVTEIDAASNTGVDNIREIIERSRFAPVQCRYKIYVIDECLTGDSLIQTSEGLMQIDNPDLKGKQVLTYNEKTKIWEYKEVLRWLERGTKQTLTIKTGSSQIRCTANHLIRTETGWIEAKNVKEGMKILSPVNANAERTSTNTEWMDEYVDSLQDISSKETNTEQNPIISAKLKNKQKLYNLCANADVKKNLIFPISCNKKEKQLKVSNHTGTDTLIEKVTDFGINEVKTSSILLNNCKLNNLDLFTELYLGMEASNIPIPTVNSLDYAGLTVQSSINGWNIKQIGYNNYDHKYEMWLIEDMVNNQLFAIQPVIPSYKKFIELLSKIIGVNWLAGNGCNLSLQKGLHGGTWMTVLFSLLPKVVLPSFFIPKGFLKQKIKLLLNGLLTWDILPTQNLILENLHRKSTITSNWEQNLATSGYQIYSNTPSLQWNTNLEKVESVSLAGYEKVYDLGVADNHNFVANDLLVHNCHMLSTAAFNALLKTLEEPPPQVVFVLATTDPQRVLSTIISRCQRFDYRRIPVIEMTRHLRYIADIEAIAIADDALTLVAQIANGGLRDAESLLDQLSLLPETITVEKVWDLVGAVPEQDLLKLLQAINRHDSLVILQQCRNLLDRGREPLVVLQNLASFYLNLLIAKTAPEHSELTAMTETGWQQLTQEAKNWQTALILRGQQHLQEGETQLKRTTQPRLWLEVILLGLLPEEDHASSTSSNLSTFDRTSPPSNLAIEGRNDGENIGEPTITQLPSAPPKQAVIQATPIAQQPARNQATVSVNHPPRVDIASPPSASNNHQDPIANQEIWNNVVSCLQPPTTQALLKQQCHLINFDGSSAIVGISSAKLHKLNQGKVPNIEAAFAQVCQRQIKVQLEVANAQGQIVHNALKSVNNQPMLETVAVAPKQPANPPSPIRMETLPLKDNHDSIKPDNFSNQNKVTTSSMVQTAAASCTKSEEVPLSQGGVSLTKDNSPTSDRLREPLPNRQRPNEEYLKESLSINSPPLIATQNNSVTSSPTIAADVILENQGNNPANSNLSPSINSEIPVAQDDQDHDLEEAINSLTQSFEGELVELDSLNNALDNAVEEEDDDEF